MRRAIGSALAASVLAARLAVVSAVAFPRGRRARPKGVQGPRPPSEPASRGAALAAILALSTLACGGGGDGTCYSFTGCSTVSCPALKASQAWEAHFGVHPSVILDPNAPVLEAQVRVGVTYRVTTWPVGAGSVCAEQQPEATWYSTNPAALSFEAGNPAAGTLTTPAGDGDAVLFALAPGDTMVYALVGGKRLELVYRNLQSKRIGVIHVVQ